MSMTDEVEFIRSMVAGPWPHDRISAEARLTDLGFASARPTVTTHEDSLIGICFFLCSSPLRHDATTQRAYEALCAAVSEEFGPGTRVWHDEETPLRWSIGDLDIEAQLFDRRDSTVMVSIEHRELAKRAEQSARVMGQSRHHTE